MPTFWQLKPIFDQYRTKNMKNQINITKVMWPRKETTIKLMNVKAKQFYCNGIMILLIATLKMTMQSVCLNSRKTYQ